MKEITQKNFKEDFGVTLPKGEYEIKNGVLFRLQSDSEGCILVGKWDKDHLINSRITWEKLYNLKQTEIKIE